jgi:lipase (class 3)
MPFNKSEALTALQLSNAAYDFADRGSAKLPAGWEIVSPIKLSPKSCVTGLMARENPVWGMTVKILDKLVGVIRGTRNLGDWIDDILFVPRMFNGEYAHGGFVELFEGVENSLLSCDAFYGHSLGASVATLAASKFNSGLITAASPRVFLQKKPAPTSWLRIANNNDLVTHKPNHPLFNHRGWALMLDVPFTFDLAKAHSITESYIPGLLATPESHILSELP